MSKTNKLFRVLKAIINKPSLLNLIIEDDNFYSKKAVNLGLGKGFPVVDLNVMFPDFQESLNHISFLDGGSLITDLALLKKLTSQYNKAQYFEIGTWRGESVVNVSEVAEKCYTLNLSSQQLTKKGLPQKYIKQQDIFSKDIPNITHLKGNSLTYDFKKYYNKFDVVFVDGDHHYDSVKKDTETAFKLIKNENSTIIWHDYGYSPEIIRDEVMCAIFDGAPKRYRPNLFHVSNTICAIFTTKEYSTYVLDSNILPNKYFKIDINIEKL